MKTYKFKINGNEYNVEINSVEGNIADVTVNGASYQVEMDASAQFAGSVASTGSATGTGNSAINNTSRNATQAVAEPVEAPAPGPKPAAPAGAGKPVTSPLPGVIIEVSVKEGQAVKAGQKVAVLEAMKMENEIQAPADGTVTAILVNKGDSVLEGAEIVKIA